jgi:helicase MOV-10
MACELAETLVYYTVKQSDVCIVSPFAVQVKLLRTLIRPSQYGNSRGLRDVDIGPLQDFQGLEKRVVILRTTRIRETFLKEDNRRELGVIGEKRKMTVALTRTKEALLVIGSPGVLMRDEHWRQWPAFCWRNGLVARSRFLGKDQNFGSHGAHGNRLWNRKSSVPSWKGQG